MSVSVVKERPCRTVGCVKIVITSFSVKNVILRDPSSKVYMPIHTNSITPLPKFFDLLIIVITNYHSLWETIIIITTFNEIFVLKKLKVNDCLKEINVF